MNCQDNKRQGKPENTYGERENFSVFWIFHTAIQDMERMWYVKDLFRSC
jgi:hypothetical protein